MRSYRRRRRANADPIIAASTASHAELVLALPPGPLDALQPSASPCVGGDTHLPAESQTKGLRQSSTLRQEVMQELAWQR